MRTADAASLLGSNPTASAMHTDAQKQGSSRDRDAIRCHETIYGNCLTLPEA